MSSKKLEKVVRQMLDTTKMRPKTLISIIYGDMMVPHGGTVWLGSLVELAKVFGVKEYLSRTSALRLVHDGWLYPTRIGRMSFYSMTDEHVRRIKEHYPQIYGPPARAWSGTWHLLLTGAAELDKSKVVELRKKLRWQGIGQLSQDVYISAADTVDSIEAVLHDLDIRDRVEVMRAESILPKDTQLLRVIAENAWEIRSVEQGYVDFLEKFRPLGLELEKADGIDPELAFVIRTLLLGDYRAVRLLDPLLPQEILPHPWPGLQAYTLCKNIYLGVLEASEAYLKATVRTADGPIGEPGELLYRRFGGLKEKGQSPALFVEGS